MPFELFIVILSIFVFYLYTTLTLTENNMLLSKINDLVWKLSEIKWDNIQCIDNVYHSEKNIGKYHIVQEISDYMRVNVYEDKECVLHFYLKDGEINVEYVNDNFYKIGDEVWN